MGSGPRGVRIRAGHHDERAPHARNRFASRARFALSATTRSDASKHYMTLSWVRALGPMKSVYFRDPDGNLLEVSNYAEAPDRP